MPIPMTTPTSTATPSTTVRLPRGAPSAAECVCLDAPGMPILAGRVFLRDNTVAVYLAHIVLGTDGEANLVAPQTRLAQRHVRSPSITVPSICWLICSSTRVSSLPSAAVSCQFPATLAGTIHR